MDFLKQYALIIWLKGPMIESLIGLVLTILMLVAKLDPAKYKHNISKLDLCLKEFQFCQTAHFVRRQTSGRAGLCYGRLGSQLGELRHARYDACKRAELASQHADRSANQRRFAGGV